MPYTVKRSSECGASKPWALVKDSTGEVMGCHASEKTAHAQHTAILISESKQRSTSMKWEHRQVGVTVTPNDDGPKQDGLPRQFWARVLNYDVIDDYGTKFKPGVFNESLSRRMPRLMYGHAGWENPAALLGRAIDYRDNTDGLDLLFEFDDFEYVPMARQIAYQMSNDPSRPTLDQFSVGFIRQRDTRDTDGKTAITKGRLGETSVVVEGSVPGTRLLQFRSSTAGSAVLDDAMISADAAARIIARFSLGEIDLVQALAEIKNVADTPDDDDDNDGDSDDDIIEASTPEVDRTDVADEIDVSAQSDDDNDDDDDEALDEDIDEEDIDLEEEWEELDDEIDALFDDVELLAYSARPEIRIGNGNNQYKKGRPTKGGLSEDDPAVFAQTWASHGTTTGGVKDSPQKAARKLIKKDPAKFTFKDGDALYGLQTGGSPLSASMKAAVRAKLTSVSDGSESGSWAKKMKSAHDTGSGDIPQIMANERHLTHSEVRIGNGNNQYKKGRPTKGGVTAADAMKVSAMTKGGGTTREDGEAALTKWAKSGAVDSVAPGKTATVTYRRGNGVATGPVRGVAPADIKKGTTLVMRDSQDRAVAMTVTRKPGKNGRVGGIMRDAQGAEGDFRVEDIIGEVVS